MDVAVRKPLVVFDAHNSTATMNRALAILAEEGAKPLLYSVPLSLSMTGLDIMGRQVAWQVLHEDNGLLDHLQLDVHLHQEPGVRLGPRGPWDTSAIEFCRKAVQNSRKCAESTSLLFVESLLWGPRAEGGMWVKGLFVIEICQQAKQCKIAGTQGC